MIDTLQSRMDILMEKHLQTERDMRELAQVTLPREIERAVRVERAKGDRRVKRAEEATEAVRLELSKEQVAKKVAIAAAQAREEQAVKKAEELQKCVFRSGSVARRLTPGQCLPRRRRSGRSRVLSTSAHYSSGDTRPRQVDPAVCEICMLTPGG